MATTAQIEVLMSVPCRWCGAGIGKPCQVRGKTNGRSIKPSSLDGDSHDRRWQDAFGTPAPVVLGRVEEYRNSWDRTDDQGLPAPPEPIPDLVSRPW
jgi:hypothetical protein